MRAVVRQISIGNPLQMIQRAARASTKASYRYVIIPMLKRKNAHTTEFVNRDPYRALQATAHLGCHPIYCPLDTMRGTAAHGRIAKLRIPRQIKQENGCVVDRAVVLISHIRRHLACANFQNHPSDTKLCLRLQTRRSVKSISISQNVLIHQTFQRSKRHTQQQTECSIPPQLISSFGERS